MCCTKDHKGTAASAADAAGAVASGVFGGVMTLVGGAIVLTIAVWFVKLILPWVLAAAGIAAAVWVTRAVLRLRRFMQRRRRVLIPAPLAAAAPRTTVEAVQVQAIGQASATGDLLPSRTTARNRR
jgi:hypothetical protein